eukprot:NODE_1264_length_1016_cov_193.543950_g879_i0.p3 GENE.NODE_1264_length_1016_cov_193.543950_g879_i0~~NODE_1264_length_1016_cov_193.543950_g879_i0.p3  ORF type:complete len:103 (+),score=37.32 NODE_1264_length_1016_cov_193.543950_g879_i0:623-931(+)
MCNVYYVYVFFVPFFFFFFFFFFFRRGVETRGNPGPSEAVVTWSTVWCGGGGKQAENGDEIVAQPQPPQKEGIKRGKRGPHWTKKKKNGKPNKKIDADAPGA